MNTLYCKEICTCILFKILLYADNTIKNNFACYIKLQKIIVLCNFKYCFKIRIIYIIIVYIACIKASINENSIRNTFTDCIPIHATFMYIVLVYILA